MKFDYLQKGFITAIPYLPAAIALYFVTRHATSTASSRGTSSSRRSPGGQHSARPVRGQPRSDHRDHHRDGLCDLLGAAELLTVPTQFLTRAAAAAGIALINTMGNVAGFAAPYITGWLKDLTGDDKVSMFVVGGSC